jgi:tetratricopeptide (TPR) repeat protein
MRKLKFLLVLIIPALLFTACSKESEETILMNAKTKMEEAKKLDAENKPDEAKKAYNEAIELYKKFLTEYPNSAGAPEAYDNIAQIYNLYLKDYTNSIKYYSELAQKHPAAKQSKYALFMIAFIYDESIKDKQKAKESYKLFLEKYPKDDGPGEKLSESARIMLQMMEGNQSIEDIIKNTQKDSTKTEQPKKTDTTSVKKKNEDPRVPSQENKTPNQDGSPDDDNKKK